MSNPTHILETALLLLAAYLLGCILGYAARRILYAARGTRQPTVVVAPAPVAETAMPLAEMTVPLPKRVPTPAARLAAAASDEPLPLRAVAKAEPTGARSTPKISPVPKPKPAPRPKRQPADPRPVALSAPRDGGADDLKQIKGIGPKIEASLNGLGIYHLDQIAGWTRANIDWVDGQLAFRGRIRREQWVEQAIELTRTRISA